MNRHTSSSLPRALEALQMTLSRIEQGEVTALEAIETLLGEEYTTRESRRIRQERVHGHAGRAGGLHAPCRA